MNGERIDDRPEPVPGFSTAELLKWYEEHGATEAELVELRARLEADDRKNQQPQQTLQDKENV